MRTVPPARVPRRAAAAAEEVFAVAGIGSSAGGLEAFSKLLQGLPDDAGIAYVLIPHLDPTHPSMLVDLLSAHTTMEVVQASDGMPLKRDRVHIIPPQAYLTVAERGVAS